jgi:predicted Zn-dependent protease
METLFRCNSVVCLFFLWAGIGTIAKAQERMTIQATAMGTSTQMGKILNVNILIQQFSTQEDRKAIIDAFARSGQDGLVRVLEDMKPKGRVRFASGAVRNDVKYIIELPSETGRRFRLVTDRNLAFGELYAGTRSRDYSVGAIDLVLTPDGKGSGTVLPARKLTVDKKKQQVEIETYQNPWKLTNFRLKRLRVTPEIVRKGSSFEGFEE